MADIRLRDIVGRGYDGFWNTHKFYRIVKGSKGSKKSKTAALWFIYNMMRYPDANLLVIRRMFTDLRASVYTDLLWAIDRFGCGSLWKESVAPLQLTYIPTGQVILFKGASDATKLGSITVRHGYLCWVWFEEFFQIDSEDEFNKITMSIRGYIPPETGIFKQITCTFNPWSEHSWIKARFFDTPADNVFAITTTYKDNDFLGEDDLVRYEELRVRNPRAARVICDGEWGSAEGVVYTNWEEKEFDYHALLGDPNIKTTFGLDFGYTVSANAFLAMAVDLTKREIWIWDEMYSRGMTNIDIARKITDMGFAKEHIIADSAEIKSITELRNGFIEELTDSDGNPYNNLLALPNIRPALKGGDSRRNGIQRIQSFKIYVHPRCKNTIIELRCYVYAQDKFGNYLDDPIKDFDHSMDAMRYGMEKFFVRPRGHIAEAKGDDSPHPHSRQGHSKRVVSTI